MGVPCGTESNSKRAFLPAAFTLTRIGGTGVLPVCSCCIMAGRRVVIRSLYDTPLSGGRVAEIVMAAIAASAVRVAARRRYEFFIKWEKQNPRASPSG